MTRFLFVVPPLVGHTNPLLGVAAELARDGHRVAWAGYGDLIRRLAGEETETYETAMPDAGLRRPPKLIGPAAFRFLWEDFFAPLAELMAPGVDAAIRAYEPDVVVADQHAVAGALVAERHGIPYVTSVTTSAELTDPLSSMPKVDAWLKGIFAGLREEFGDPARDDDPRFSPHGIIAFTGRALLGDGPLPWNGVRLVGPTIDRRPSPCDFPYDELDPGRRKVLVTLGTANAEAGERFLGEAVAALESMRESVQGIVVDPGGVLGAPGQPGRPGPAGGADAGERRALDGQLDRAARESGLLVRDYVPQLELLPHLDAVVCHGGHNTVCESLWHGVPLVLAPIRDDQPIVSGQVVEAGAGVRVRFNRVDAERLATAVRTVLDPAGGHRAAAEEIGRSLREAGGARAAAEELGRIAARQADYQAAG
ncbi:UDP:flavonoid glycosyltransferase YjiC (YdhE family) [Streptomyces sp. Amel2xB2]|uniref:glycosyltransferase n=1 Tax=Streptomyces sp. Amel2xB2 TaxID=1305829 RepID=UPI000DBAD94C|nr:glycosyltransferase [Streptomyces sp. Amel2xB2]RAJ58871.1 UDP:flavonoid glycosyltransferase YjiC (YdhE family) [Streptomyces sp. Amel2xB2]